MLFASAQRPRSAHPIRPFVFEANPEKFELVATNPLSEPSNSTPAISNGEVFIRTHEAL